MQKAFVFLLLQAVFVIGLTSPTHNDKVKSKDSRLEYAEIEQTMLLDLVRGIGWDILDELHDLENPDDLDPIAKKQLSFLNKIENFLDNKFDPNGPITQLKYIIDITKDLLNTIENSVPDQKKK